MKKDFQWAIWLFVIIITVIASSCGKTQVRYKCHHTGGKISKIIDWTPGYAKGDTIIYEQRAIVIDSILSK